MTPYLNKASNFLLLPKPRMNTVENEISPLSLAYLCRLDWAVVEQAKLVKMTKRSIADLTAANVDCFEQIKALATLYQALVSLTQKRDEVRNALLSAS
jgi:hypothetical protein